MSDLANRLEHDLAPAWRPDQEDPDILIGEVVSIEAGSSDYGTYPLIVVRQDDGTEKAIHAFHTVLRNELVKQRPQIGERLGVKYLGKMQAAEGSKYGSYIGYRAKVERAAGLEFNWDRMGADSDLVAFDDLPGAKQQTTEPVSVPAGAESDDIPF